MKNVRKAVSVLLCTSLIANNTSSIIALSSTENNVQYENTQTIRLGGEIQKIEWTTPDSINLGEKFDAMNGVKALDKDGKDITDKVQSRGSVDTSKPGEYKIEYFIPGEEDKKTYRTIKVVDKENKEKGENSTEAVVKTEITGTQIVRVYQGDIFDTKFDIKATDEIGQDITSKVQVEGSVDTNTPGEYKLKYSVKSDSEQEDIFERTVKVIEKNVFNFYINKDNENVHGQTNPETIVTENVKNVGFSLYLDLNTSKFVINNQSPEMLDKAKPKEVYANISVFDKENKEKLSLELLGEDTGNSKKFDKLKELVYEYGDFIQVSLSNPKDNFDISGKIPGDVITEKVDENTIIQEDYKDGVDNLEYINNVRFEITEEGIKSVYNKAPEITGLTDMNELLTDREKQLEGVVVSDDRDGVIPNDNIQIVEEKNDKGNVIGLRYTVEDSWGRSISSVRNLVKNTHEVKNKLSYLNQRPHVLSDNVITVKGFTYNDGADVRFKMNFDHNYRKISIFARDERLFDNKVSGKYFEITLYDKNGQFKRRLTLNGDDKSSSNKIDEFVKEPFEFGDQIHLYHRYSKDKLLIEGTIKDLGNDVGLSNGVSQEIIQKSRFKLEKDGLVYLRNEAPNIQGTETALNVVIGQKPDFFKGVTVNDDLDGLIENSKVEVTGFKPNQLGTQTITYTVSDSWGETTTVERQVIVTSETRLANTSIDVYDNNGSNKVFSIKFDDINKKIKIEDKSNTQLESTNDTAFRIKILSKAGITKKTVELKGNENGNSDKLNELHDYSYVVGDYIELWRKPTTENTVPPTGEAGETTEDTEPPTGETEETTEDAVPTAEETEEITEGTVPTTKSTVKGIKIVGNIEKDDEIKDSNYEDGIDNIDHMLNVRFMIDKDTLFASYNNAPTINFVSDLTIKRGEKFDPINFVLKVDDDHDNLSNNLVRASYNKEEIQKVGDHTVTYTVRDKWGRSSGEIKQTIKVLPKNNLEENKIVLKKQLEDGTDKDIVTLHFDDVNNKIVKEIVDGESISGTAGTDVFSIAVFDGSGSKVAESTLKANQSLNANSLKEITEVTLGDDYSISVRAYDKDKLCIKGNVGSTKESQSETSNKPEFIFKDDDEMNNTRFALRDIGLFKIYNKAPEFIGVEDVSIIKGSKFNELDGVSVVDDHDRTIQISKVNVDTHIDISKVGTQKITYTVSDSWGRSTMVTRNVLVKPIAVNNSIEVKDSGNELAFKIGFDFERNRLVIDSIKNGSLNSSNTSTEIYIAIYDDRDDLIDSVTLLGNDTNISEKLNNLIDDYIGVNTSIRVWSKDPNKVAIKGNIIDSETGEEESYSEVVNSQEEINNVKFQISEDGLKVIYNNAPQIILPNGETVLYKGDNYKEGLLNNVEIKDDHDVNIDTKKVKFKIKKIEQTQEPGNQPEEVTENQSESEDGFEVVDSIGNYEAEYEITDSWGRTSTIKRAFKVENSMGRHEIIFGGYNQNLPEAERSSIKPLVIYFDPESMKFKVRSYTNEQFNNAPGMNDTVIHSLYIYDGNTNRPKFEVSMLASDAGNNQKFRNIENVTINYGDYIKFYDGTNNGQTFRLKIQGPVRNTSHDYSKGANNGEEFINSKFYIEEEGLTAQYTHPIVVNENETVFEYVGAGGVVPLRILFNYDNRTMTVSGNETTRYAYVEDSHPDNNRQQLKIRWHGSDGREKTSVSLRINADKGPGEVKNAFNRVNSGSNGTYTFEDGDYLTFESRDSNKIRIHNNFENTTSDTNLSDGINSDDIVQNSRFILGEEKESSPESRTTTSNKTMKVLYNAAPVIKGIDDANIYVGDNFDLKAGVTVEDTIDNKNGQTVSYTVTKTSEQIENQAVRNTEDTVLANSDAIGKQVYTYTATDSWGRIGTYTRTVYVRPEVFKNKISLYPKEKALESSTEPVQPNPLFEIGFDNDTRKYTVSNQSNDFINQEIGTDTAFRISIYSGTGEHKKTVELRGIDRGTNEAIAQLKEIQYSYDDCIRVWSADSKQLRISGTISGDVTTPPVNEVNPLNTEGDNTNTEVGDTNVEQTKKEENYSDGIDEKDYMENVAFQAKQSGIKTIYNNAPVINTEKINKEVLFASQNIDLKEGIEVSDDKGELQTSSIKVSGEEVNFEKIGSYKVTYSISDSWGRVGTADVTYNVVSKLKNNTIDIYDNSQHILNIKFNIGDNTFDVERKTSSVEGDTPGVEDANQQNTINSESTEPYFEFILRNEDTSEKKKITASNKEELNSKITELENINFSDGDTIELYSNNKSNIKINGNIENKNDGEDFGQSFPSSLNFRKTRFIIGNKGLDVLRYEVPTISFTNGDSLSVTRGESETPKQDVKITYTNPVNKNGISFEIQEFNPLNIGEQATQYVFKDSWGETHTKNRTITVEERNELEKNKIKVIDFNNNNNLITFEFDTIENIIKPNIISDVSTNIEGDLIVLTLYDETGITKDSIRVDKNNLNNVDSIDYVEGDLIGISSYNPRNGLSINGTIHEEKEPYLDGVNDEDNIVNVRFKIDEKGLQSVYNNAPILTITEDLQTFKDESVDFYKNVSISDDDPHDKGVINEQDNIQISTDLDITKIGDYTARYTLSDTWGRSVFKDRKIVVKSSLGNNKIQYFPPDSEEAAFSISMDTTTNKLKVEKIHEDLKVTPITRFINRIIRSTDSNNSGEGTDNQGTGVPEAENPESGNSESGNETSGPVTPGAGEETPESVTPGAGEGNSEEGEGTPGPGTPEEGNPGAGEGTETPENNKIFEVVLFTEDMKVKKELTIESTDDTESVISKLNDFNDTDYKHGDFIGVYAKDKEKGIKILGNIDIPYEIKEKYDDGIQNDDFMNNVRFNIKQDAIYAIYNQAPTMNVPSDVVEVYKGDEIHVYENVRVSDDLDKDISNINITISEEDRQKLNTIGEQQTVTLILSDSWGRSVSATRTYNVKNALERNIITFNAHNRNVTKEAFEISFDLKTNRLRTRQILTEGVVNDDASGIIYRIEIYDKDGALKRDPIEFSVKDSFGTGGEATNKISSIDGLEFAYGDYIKFSGVQIFRVGIKGEVRNPIEDYSDKIQQVTDGKNTKFIIEDSGIRTELDNVDNLTESQNIIEFLGSGGRKPLRMKIDNESGDIDVLEGIENDVDGSYDYQGNEFGVDKPILTITLHRTSGENISVTAKAQQTAGHNVFERFDGATFSEGDYIEIRSLKPSGVRILGNVEYNEDEYPGVDFSMGFDTAENLDKSNLYLGRSNDGIKTIEIQSDPTPIVIDAEDVRVEQKDPNFSLTNGVKVDYGNGVQVPIPESAARNGIARLSNGDTVRIDGTVDVNQIGLYAVTYTVTNSYGITVSKTRNINVYAPPGLVLKNEGTNPTIEKGSILTNNEAIKERLKTFVVATDTDGTDISDKIQVDLNGFDQEKEGNQKVIFSVKNGFNEITRKDVDFTVVRTISVGVPTKIPFQVVTNLMDSNNNDEFISGVLKLTNNRTSDVDVYLEAFNAQDGNTMQIVDPSYTDNWDNLSVEDSMTKMALGLYTSENINGGNINDENISKSNPVWLESDKRDYQTKLGTIPRATLSEKTPEGSETPTKQGESSTDGNDISPGATLIPTQGRISFTSKHGKNFKGGNARGKFDLVFSFR